jgi:hypothetical protein
VKRPNELSPKKRKRGYKKDLKQLRKAEKKIRDAEAVVAYMANTFVTPKHFAWHRLTTIQDVLLGSLRTVELAQQGIADYWHSQ